MDGEGRPVRTKWHDQVPDSRKDWREPLQTSHRRLVGDNDAALEKHLLDQPEAQGNRK
jgi:hypothetical protein